MAARDEWVDVTVPLRAGMVHWPGTPEIGVESLSDVGRGDAYSMRHLSMDTHAGTHIDAPSHFVEGGATIDQMPFETTNGRARVVEISDPIAIRPQELVLFDIQPGERVLFKTLNSWRCWQSDKFVEDYVYLSFEGALYLVTSEVMTVGIDYLSIASIEEEVMVQTHKALLNAGVGIIEGLDLRGVDAGSYEMACLPLRIEGSDGSPCRAFLRPIS